MRALVVGHGRMGGFHRRVLIDLGLDVTTVDPAPGVADYTQVPARVFDVVCVAVPMEHLAEQAARWEGFGGWLLIEKPGATTAADALELAGLLEGQRVAVGFVERFNPRVRALRSYLADCAPVTLARFVRWNDRSSTNVELDLGSHDVDLAVHLDLTCPVSFDWDAGSAVKARAITLCHDTGSPPRAAVTVDLMAHTTSPLHAQWHAFLGVRTGLATLQDTVETLTTLEAMREPLCA